MIIYKEFTFDSAHYLPYVSDTHKCRAIHGHTYKITIFLQGRLIEELGWVEDFGHLKSVIQPIIRLIDHKLLNDIPGLKNPTSELLVMWLWNKIKPVLPTLKKIELKETASSGVIYEG